MIRKATSADLPAVGETYTQLLTHEQAHGSHTNWKMGIYPTEAFAADNIDAMYVLEDGGQIAASMILDHQQAPEYDAIPWQYPGTGAEVLVIHTLCIPPALAGRGFGGRMVAFAKDFARDHGCTTIRIDTYIHNEPAKALYRKYGFRIAGHGHCLHHGLFPTELAYLECPIEETTT